MNTGTIRSPASQRLVEDIGAFYSEFANAYSVIAEDRDFTQEVAALVGSTVRRKRFTFLELFAGPAFHARVARDQYDAVVYCVDSSPAMKALALQSLGSFPASNYILGTLPSALTTFPENSIDLAFAPRFSIGYLQPEQTTELFEHIWRVLTRHGSLFFELHDLELLRAQLAGLAIRTRHRQLPTGERLTCIWPSEELDWCPHDWKVTMAINLRCTNGNGVSWERTFSTTEHIYSVGDLRRIAKASGKFEMADVSNLSGVFKGAKIVRFVKK